MSVRSLLVSRSALTWWEDTDVPVKRDTSCCLVGAVLVSIVVLQRIAFWATVCLHLPLPHYPSLSPLSLSSPLSPTLSLASLLSSTLSLLLLYYPPLSTFLPHYPPISPFLPHYPPLSPLSSPLPPTLSPFLPHYPLLSPLFFPTTCIFAHGFNRLLPFTDINECLVAALDIFAADVCEPSMFCVNVVGSYRCDCPAGTLLVDGVCEAGKCLVEWIQFNYWPCIALAVEL